MQSHATVPTPFFLGGHLYRIFFSTRDALNRNQIGYVDIDIRRPDQLLYISERPAIGLGDLGEFDCDGVYAGCVVALDGKEVRFYYAGWNAGLRGLFYSSIGVAISRDGGETFNKHTNAPILGRDAMDKWAVMAPFVRFDNGHWTMWYASGIRLYREGGQLRSFYDVKVALSNDGLVWRKTGTTAISLGEEDSNIARACVLHEPDGLYRAWYPYVRKSLGEYRIGYAESRNGLQFTRMDDEIQFDVLPASTWESRALCYPFVFRHGDKMYMLYNGDDFGRAGFGLAVLEH